jgi:hypothetical protein
MLSSQELVALEEGAARERAFAETKARCEVKRDAV